MKITVKIIKNGNLQYSSDVLRSTLSSLDSLVFCLEEFSINVAELSCVLCL